MTAQAGERSESVAVYLFAKMQDCSIMKTCLERTKQVTTVLFVVM